MMLNFPIPPEWLLVIVVVIVIVVAVAAARRRGPKSPTSTPLMKQVDRMKSSIDKGRPPPEVSVMSRQTIITRLFEEKLEVLGLEPSASSGHIPVVLTPLATFLTKHGLDDDTVGAIVSELRQLETRTEVEDIIEAAAETPGVVLKDEDIEQAKHLALDEWVRLRRKSE